MRAPSILALCIAPLALAPGGCILSHDLSWEIDWAEPALADRAVSIEAQILQGGCDSTEVVWAAESNRGGFHGESPPDLDEGVYGFAARARDVHCRTFAEACRQRKLPGDNDDQLRLVLSGGVDEPACPDELCIAGQCACSAPGSCGSACVGPDCSCGFGECILRCTDDGACDCGGGSCYMRCDPGAACNCAGGDCVMDCAPGASCDCVAGDCTMVCASGASCSCLAGGCR